MKFKDEQTSKNHYIISVSTLFMAHSCVRVESKPIRGPDMPAHSLTLPPKIRQEKPHSITGVEGSVATEDQSLRCRWLPK